MIYSSKRGFTLLELLIAVAIFSGLAILTLGIFARSASTSLKTNDSRQRTQFARQIIDLISKDLRLVYRGGQLQDVYSQSTTSCDSRNPTVEGYDFTDRCIVMVLRYPNDPQNQFVWKMYMQNEENGAVSVLEKRGCTIESEGARGNALACPNSSAIPSELVGSETDQFTTEVGSQLFTGLSPMRAQAINPSPVPFVKMAITIKPKDLQELCAQSPSQCYTVSTTISSGGEL